MGGAERLLGKAGALCPRGGAPIPAPPVHTAKGGGAGMIVYVRTDTETLPVEVGVECNIADLRQAVEQALGKIGEFTFSGEVLRDEQATLADLGIGSQAVVDMQTAMSFRWKEVGGMMELSEDGCTVTQKDSSKYAGAKSVTVGGRCSWQVRFSGGTNGATVGVAHPDVGLMQHVYSNKQAWVYTNHGSLCNDESDKSSDRVHKKTVTGYKDGDVILMELDMTSPSGSLTFYKNGTLQNTLDGVKGPVCIWVGLYTQHCSATLEVPDTPEPGQQPVTR
eukprot:TRINITY_DN2189_c0_g1_i1.p1 TRINITY_DN2189_c0_g1~~TRINITY_DN2189_c0_g1_i1.p1  ORF type:complete len:304 (+),score=70.00 TRINITY_DN2189_c0_g1_i1:81-914(+)